MEIFHEIYTGKINTYMFIKGGNVMTFLNAIFAKNLMIVASFFGVFVLCVLADIIAKTFFNVSNMKEDFSVERLVKGLLRMVCLAVSSAILSFVISTIPSLIPMVGIELSEEVVVLFSIATVAGVYLNGIIKYFKSAFDTINRIINDEKLFELKDKEDGVEL